MTGTPTPEAVEPISDADLAERTKWLDCNGPAMANLTVGEARAIIARLRLAESRALPAPRRYTGGPLEDGLYLWRPALWGAGLRDWASIDTSTLTGRYDLKEIVEAEAEVWLIGPIPIPDLPDEEAANG